jgi:hypothetical protein
MYHLKYEFPVGGGGGVIIQDSIPSRSNLRKPLVEQLSNCETCGCQEETTYILSMIYHQILGEGTEGT